MSDLVTYAFIFARGGSKGVPRKNIREMAGKPLIAYSIELALSLDVIDRVIVSTDDKEIASISKSYGAEVPFIRPSDLAGDKASEWFAWQHAIEFVGQDSFDTFISLPTTSPLRNQTDVENCLNLFAAEDVDFVLTMRNAERSPYFNLVEKSENGLIGLSPKDGSQIKRRQDAPACYDLTTVAYVSSPKFIMNNNSIWDGKVTACVIPKERAFDIDDEVDFEIVEYYMNKSRGE